MLQLAGVSELVGPSVQVKLARNALSMYQTLTLDFPRLTYQTEASRGKQHDTHQDQDPASLPVIGNHCNGLEQGY